MIYFNDFWENTAGKNLEVITNESHSVCYSTHSVSLDRMVDVVFVWEIACAIPTHTTIFSS